MKTDSGCLATESTPTLSPKTGETLPIGSALRVATIANLSRLGDGESITLADALERLGQINEIASELYGMCRAQRAHR